MDFESIDDFCESDGLVSICIATVVTAAILAISIAFLGGNAIFGAIAGVTIGCGGAALLGWRKVALAVGIGLVAGAAIGGITWWICSANSLDIDTPRFFAALIAGWLGLCFALFRQDPNKY